MSKNDNKRDRESKDSSGVDVSKNAENTAEYCNLMNVEHSISLKMI